MKTQKEQILTIEDEIWLPIGGRCGYEVSNHGQVRSLTRYVDHARCGKKLVNGRILKLNKSRAGYLQVQTGGNHPTTTVHRLVANTFLKNKNGLPCVNHIDGVKTNNHCDNLEWCTYSQNERHSYDVLGKTSSKNNLGNLGILSASAIPVAELSDDKKVINIWGSASEAAREVGSSQGRISAVCRGEAVNGKTIGRRFIYCSRKDYHDFQSNRMFFRGML